MRILTAVLGRAKDYGIRCWMASGLIVDTSGVTAIEYGLIAALIAVAAVTIMGTVGQNLTSIFTTVAADL